MDDETGVMDSGAGGKGKPRGSRLRKVTGYRGYEPEGAHFRK